MKKYSCLYIAEKPDIGRALAAYLWPDGANKQKGFIEQGDVCVTWAFGHILGLAQPSAYGEEYKEWRNYPIVPKLWKLHPAEGCREQLSIIKGLLKEADSVVHAGDPDREGQLLIDEILLYLGYKGPVKRILIQAKDTASLKRAFAAIDDNNKYRNLYVAGVARERADWLIGMNLTRAYTIRARKYGYDATLRIGRVKVPTLALVVQREKEIARFKSVQHYTLQGTFIKDGITFQAVWQPAEKLQDADSHVLNQNIVQAIHSKLQGGSVTVESVEAKEVCKAAPLPYSLDTLQAEANQQLGLSPKAVLQLVQNLYEKKLVSYPRSDCNYLPVSQHEDAAAILAILSVPGIDQADVSKKGRAFNDAKITAHHAIVPTTIKAEGLTKDEAAIYTMIAKRYVMQFLPYFTYQEVRFTLLTSGERFAGSGKLIYEAGWKTYQKAEKKREDGENLQLPQLAKGNIVEAKDYILKAKKTTSPKRFTEGTLLSAMANIWRYMAPDNPNRDKLKEVKGIGTPATRDTIIAELLATTLKGKPVEPCLKKKGKELQPTDFGRMLVENVNPSLTVPDTTAEMEYQLTEIAQGKCKLSNYLDEVITMLHKSIQHAEQHAFPAPDKKDKPLCPVCKAGCLVRRYSPKTQKYFHICSDPSCVSPSTGRKLFYDDNNGKPMVELCPTCGDVLVHFIKPDRAFWLCAKCDRFYSDIGGRLNTVKRSRERVKA